MPTLSSMTPNHSHVCRMLALLHVLSHDCAHLQVDEEDLSVLAGLLYMAIPSKTQLQRVFSNAVINHSTTRSQALRILLSFLRSNSPSTSPRFGEPAPAAFGMQALQVFSLKHYWICVGKMGKACRQAGFALTGAGVYQHPKR